MRRTAAGRSPVLETCIGELAPGGDGVVVAELDGVRRAIFVRGVAPGDRVRLVVDPTHRPARGRVVELLEPGPQRVAPACAHAARCGGCDWMHISHEAQRATHTRIVRAALPASWQGHGIVMHAAPELLGYRTRARLHVRASGGRAIVGIHEAESHDPVEVDRCVVLHPTLDSARIALAELLEGAHGRGEARLALGAFGADRRLPVLHLQWSGRLAAPCFARFEAAVVGGQWGGVQVRCGEAARPATIGDPTPWIMGADGVPLRLVPAGFAQASEAQNRALAWHVAEVAATHAGPEPRTVELYAGAGNLTVLLARSSRNLVAVESDRDACAAARLNLAARAASARVIEGDARSYIWSPATTLLALDPPRAGAREVVQRLVDHPVRHVLYVSCDPQTLGRDAHVLSERGYRPCSIALFEMFPHTSHVETVLFLGRARGDARDRSGRR